jgi:hypothetical protein
MQNISIPQETPQKSMFQESIEKCGSCKGIARRSEIRLSLLRLRHGLLDKWYIVYLAFRSLHGRIWLQFAKGLQGVSLGPRYHLKNLNVQTAARRLYTKRLSEILPWIDFQDLRIFLMGFEAGEEFACCNAGKQWIQKIGLASSWLTPEKVEEINRTLQSIRQSTIPEDSKHDL